MTVCRSLCSHLFSYFVESGSSLSTMPAVYCPGNLPPVNVIHTAVLPQNCLHASEVIENKSFEGKTETKTDPGGWKSPWSLFLQEPCWAPEGLCFACSHFILWDEAIKSWANREQPPCTNNSLAQYTDRQTGRIMSRIPAQRFSAELDC